MKPIELGESGHLSFCWVYNPDNLHNRGMHLVIVICRFMYWHWQCISDVPGCVMLCCSGVRWVCAADTEYAEQFSGCPVVSDGDRLGGTPLWSGDNQRESRVPWGRGERGWHVEGLAGERISSQNMAGVCVCVWCVCLMWPQPLWCVCVCVCVCVYVQY